MKVRVNDNTDFLGQDLNSSDWDVRPLGGGEFHLLHQGKAFRCSIMQADPRTKTLRVKVNGSEYALNIKDRYDELLEALGMDQMTEERAEDLRAPMPGLVLEVSVEAGQSVKKGDPLMILEAMKMENVLKAAADATVDGVEIAKGDAVEKGQTLIRFS